MGENLLVPGFPIVSPLPAPLPHQAVGASQDPLHELDRSHAVLKSASYR